MVAIKQAISALPLLLAVASQVTAQQVGSEDTLQLRDEEQMLEERGAGHSKPSKPTIGKPTNVKGTHPIAMSDKDLKSSKKRPVSSTSSNGDPFYLEKYVKKGKREDGDVEERDLEERGAGHSKPSKPTIGKPTNVKGTHPITMSDKDLKSSKKRPVSSTSSNGDPFYLEKYVKKGKREEGDFEERDFDEELDERDFDEELDERDFDDELYERDFDEELDERDFDDELYERDFDDELYERDFDEELYERALEMRGNGKSKIDKTKIGKPTNVKGTHPITMSDKDLKSSKPRPVSSTSSNGDPFYLEKYVKKGKRGVYGNVYARGNGKSKIDKTKIGKPTNPKGTNPVVMSDKDLKSSKRPVSSSSGYIPIALDPKLKKGKRSMYGSMYRRGNGKSKIDKSKIGKPTNPKGTNPVVMSDKDLKSSKRPVSSSSGYIPIALDPKLKKGKRSIYRRGNGKSKIDKTKIGKPTNVKGTHPITMSDKDLKSSTKRPVSTTSSNGDPFYLEKYVKKGKRGMYARGAGHSKPSKPTIGKPTNVKGTHPITMSDKDLKSSKKRPVSTTSSNGDPFYLEKYVKKGKRDYAFDYDYYFA